MSAKLKRWVGGGIALIVVVAGLIAVAKTIKPTQLSYVAHEDPELQAASRQAQKELDGFIKELENPKPNEQFAVKGAFPTGMGPEYLWVRSVTYRDGAFNGTLDQVPAAYEKAKKGDEVSVKRADVFDWLIKEDGQLRGGYTEKVLSGR